MRTFLHSLRVLTLGALLVLTAQAIEPAKKNYDLPAGDAVTRLKQFSEVSGRETLFAAEAVRGVRTMAIKGEFTPKEALDEMLQDTGLVSVQDEKTGAFAVRRGTGPNGPRAARTSSARPSDQKGEVRDGVLRLDTFEVMGSKLLNMDKPRSRDDTQPYVIFNRDTIANSGAANLEEFFRNRLTMETTALPESQTNSFLGARSSINLRGLGTNQTLILVDGHRMAGVLSVGNVYQPDVNGIPLEAVERIEILPTSASGIYGGNATGGVVNIILRRDYAGVEVKLTYANTFDTDAATRRIDLSAGTTLFHGRTNVLLAASASDANRLLTQDRNFRERGVARILANSPGFFLDASLPPFGSTTNIRSTNGANLVLKNGTALNSPRTFVPTGYAGPATDQGQALVANAGKYNFETAQTISSGLRPLLNAPSAESLMLTVRHRFSPLLQGFLELGGANNSGQFSYVAMPSNFTLQANNPNNPFTQAIRVLTPLYGVNTELTSVSQDRRLVAGLIVQLPGEWKGEMDYNLHRTRFTSQSFSSQGLATTAVTNGTLNLLRDTRAFPVDFSPYVDQADVQLPTHAEMRTITARASGPVGKLPAGRPTVSALIERRVEDFDPSVKMVAGAPSGSPESQFQRVHSAYLEARVPLISTDASLPLVRELELTAAGRWDSYASEGTSFATGPGAVTRARNEFDSVNPTIGLRWVATPSVMLRASYGTGFLPPSLTDLVPSTFAFAGFYQDPRRGNETLGAFTYSFGGNSHLKPERSNTWSAGIVLTPEALPGLRVSADWSRIEKTDNITEPDPADMLAHEDLFPGRIIRAAPAAGDPYGVGPIIGIDGSAINIARADVESIDLAADYTRESTFGRWDFYALATVARHFRTQLLPTLPVVEHIGMGNSVGMLAGGGAYPVRLRGNLGFTWSRGRLKAGWTMRYIDDYQIDATSIGPAILLAQGNNGRVDRQVFHDCFVAYDFGHPGDAPRWRRLLTNTEVRVGVMNVFNAAPAFDASNSATYTSGFGDPRLANYSLSLKRRF